MHFIPNPANTEFIYLCGLEECVSRILNLDTDSPAQPMPFVCTQCGTDFTPTWKWDKAAKGRNNTCDYLLFSFCKLSLECFHLQNIAVSSDDPH